MKNSVILFRDPPRIVASASAVGAEEAKGPLGKQFDFSDLSDRFGGDTWEHAEACLSSTVFSLLMNKAKFDHRQVDMLFAGDLQNQCVASSEGLMGFGIPYVGLYGACSTCGEGLMQAALALSVPHGIRYAVSLTTSHYCAAERQYRTPLEYGCQRPPTAQWTATAGGGFLLTKEKRGWVEVEAVMPGRIVDSGIRDASNMGAAMAPAVVDSLHRYFEARRLILVLKCSLNYCYCIILLFYSCSSTAPPSLHSSFCLNRVLNCNFKNFLVQILSFDVLQIPILNIL